MTGSHMIVTRIILSYRGERCKNDVRQLSAVLNMSLQMG